MPRVFHLLPEGEAFSEFHGGAISRWVANVLRDDPTGTVVCSRNDSSWKFAPASIMRSHWLGSYQELLRCTSHHVPWILRKRILRFVFRDLLRQVGPGDILWIHNRPEFAAALCEPAHRAAVKVVLHMHNAHLQTASPAILRDLHADRVVFVSHYLAEACQATLLASSAVEVLHNGADGDLFHPAPVCTPSLGGPMKVLFASRLVKEKGPHVFSEALRRLQQAHVPVVGVVVGGVGFGGSQPDQFVARLMHDAPENVTFHPYCAGDKLAKLFQGADVFCLPSIWNDPFPLAPLEAMAAGLPVVASRSGGIPEALFDGGGILVERDSVESLTHALQQLAEDATLRRKLAIQARASFERNFQWQNVREHYGAITRRLQHV